MKGTEVQLSSFLIVTLDGNGWVDLRLGCFNHGDRTASNHLLVHQGKSGRFGEEKSLAFAENLNPDHPANSLVAILTELPLPVS
jgi:hypothetical protein